MRFSPDLGPAVTTAWWWPVFVARYFVWLLFSLNVVLLAALWQAARNAADQGGVQAMMRAAQPSVPACHSRGWFSLCPHVRGSLCGIDRRA